MKFEHRWGQILKILRSSTHKLPAEIQPDEITPGSYAELPKRAPFSWVYLEPGVELLGIEPVSDDQLATAHIFLGIPTKGKGIIECMGEAVAGGHSIVAVLHEAGVPMILPQQPVNFDEGNALWLAVRVSFITEYSIAED